MKFKILSVLVLSLVFASGALAYSGPEGANYNAESVFIYNSAFASYINQTSQSSNSTASDVDMPNSVGDVLYIGSSEPFDGISMKINDEVNGQNSLTSETGTYEIEYYTSGAWQELDLGLSSREVYPYNFKNGGTASPTDVWTRVFEGGAPSDWQETSVNGETYYWARIRVTQVYSDNAIAEQIGLIHLNLGVNVKDQFGTALTGMEEVNFNLVGKLSSFDSSIYYFTELSDGFYGLAISAPPTNSNEYTLTLNPNAHLAEAYSGELDVNKSAMEISISLEASHLYTAQDSYSNSVSIASAESTGNGSPVTCTISSGKAYCAIGLDQDNDDTTFIYANGYVTQSITTTDRVLSSDAQAIYTVSMPVAYLATIKSSDGSLISGATVKAGSSYSTTCSEVSSGVYSCPVPTSNASTAISITASGYESMESSFSSIRSDSFDPQVTQTFTLNVADSGTSPTDPDDETDSDGDGASDSYEIETGTDPNDADDFLADYPDSKISCTHPYTDIIGHWAEQAVCVLYKNEVLAYNTLFRPSDQATRAEFLKMVLANADTNLAYSGATEYSDLDSGHWSYAYFMKASELGVIEGYPDGSVKPDAPINRAEAIVIVMRFYGQSSSAFDPADLEFTDVSESDWFAYATVIGSNEGILQGYTDSTFRPANDISRAEVSVIVRRAFYAFE